MAFLLSASIALAASLLAAAPIAEHSCEVLHFLARPPLEFSGPADGFNDGTMSAWLVCNGPGTDCASFPDDVLEPAFTGKELDEESGLYYFEARYLDPRIGRFTSPDEGPFKLQDPQSFNRYAYAQNSPFKYRDSDGRVIDTILDIGFIAYDVFDIARSLVRGEGIRGTQLAALGADIGGAFAPFATGGGAAVRAAAHARAAESAAAAAGGVASGGGSAVIGKLSDLKNIGAGERTLLERMPNLGSPKANWNQNSSVLRQEMSLGQPIRDASTDASGRLINNTGFLRAERNLLQDHGWTYDPATTLWSPPVP